MSESEKERNQLFEANKNMTFTFDDMRRTWNIAFSEGMRIDEEDYTPTFFHNYITSLINEKNNTPCIQKQQ